MQPNYPAKTTASVTPTPPRKNTPSKNKEAMNKEKDAKDASDLEEPVNDGLGPEELAAKYHGW